MHRISLFALLATSCVERDSDSDWFAQATVAPAEDPQPDPSVETDPQPEPEPEPTVETAPRPVSASEDLDGELKSPLELMSHLDSSTMGTAPLPDTQVKMTTTAAGFPTAISAVSSDSASWGVRLVSTVVDAQPPRAILGLPDGSEAVVKPGSLLPDVGIVVLAIGKDQVQIAEVTAEGDHARVVTRTVTSMYPRD